MARSSRRCAAGSRRRRFADPSRSAIRSPICSLAPWAYLDFMSVCVSILCWLGILVAAIATIDGSPDSPTVVSATVLFSMAMNLLLSFCG